MRIVHRCRVIARDRLQTAIAVVAVSVEHVLDVALVSETAGERGNDAAMRNDRGMCQGFRCEGHSLVVECRQHSMKRRMQRADQIGNQSIAHRSAIPLPNTAYHRQLSSPNAEPPLRVMVYIRL